MFQFNLTLWVIFVSFAIFIALMKSLFFDKIAWIKQQREEKLEQLHRQSDGYISDCQTLEASYQKELLLIKQEAARLFEEKLKRVHAENAAALQASKASFETALQEHRSGLRQWEALTLQELTPHKQVLELAILKQLHLSDVVTVGSF